jgi:hypothetical protein
MLTPATEPIGYKEPAVWLTVFANGYGTKPAMSCKAVAI